MRQYYIQDLSIAGYRKFSDEQVLNAAYPDLTEGSGLNVIVGSIGAGKTSLLEMVGLVCGLGLPDYDKMILNDSLATGEFPKVSATWISPAHESDPQVTYRLETEWSYQGRTLQYSPVKKLPDDSTGESYPNEGQLIKYIRPNRSFTGEASSNGPAVNHGLDRESRGETINLAGVVNYFVNPPVPGITLESFREVIKKYSHLGILIEDIRLSEPPRGGQPISHFEAKLRDGDWHNIQDLSDGTKELLWWIFELHFGETNNYSIVCIDEIERSLHPQIQTALMGIIKERAKHQQYFITAHSTYIADAHTVQKIHHIGIDGQITSINKGSFPPPSIFTVDHNRLFFAEDTLFVEGVDDLAFYTDKLIEFGHPELVDRLFIAGGKGNIKAFETVCKTLNISFHAIVDDDFSDKVTQLSSGNRKLMQRVLDKLVALKILDEKDFDANDLEKKLATPPKIEANKAAELVSEKNFRKVINRNIYPLRYGRLEEYKQGQDRTGTNVLKEQNEELKEIFEIIRQ